MRILLIDDDRAAVQCIRVILKDLSSFIGVAGSGKDAVARSREQSFDLVILDLTLPDMHGLDVLRELRISDPVVPILVLTGDASVDMRVDCLESGADDYLTKPFNASELIARVRAVERRAIEPTKLLEEAREATGKMAPLSTREREVVALLVAGHSNKVAAHELGISTRTVEAHRARIMKKLLARNLSDVVRIALAASRFPGPSGLLLGEEADSANLSAEKSGRRAEPHG